MLGVALVERRSTDAASACGGEHAPPADRCSGIADTLLRTVTILQLGPDRLPPHHRGNHLSK